MQLTGKTTAERCLQAGDRSHAHVRPASLDLSVGEVFRLGKKVEPPFVIEPQQIVVIVSRETLTVPPGVIGYAMPKTSLCNQGILAFNTGLVDPGYSGRISTVAINFSRNPIPLQQGEEFLRFVLHELDGDEDSKDGKLPKPPMDADFARRSVSYPETFLDVPGQTDRLVREVTSDVVDRQRNAVLLLISTIGFMFVLWNFASYFLLSRQANVIAERTLQSEVKAADFVELKGRVAELKTRVDTLAAHAGRR